MEEKLRHRFCKAERLRHKTLVDGLFAEGTAKYEFPLRITWRVLSPEELQSSFRGEVPNIAKLQMMITVPKKKRRHAVDRVLMRRRIREAYRLQRHELQQAVEANPAIGTLSIGFIYIHNENCDYRLVAKRMKKLLDKVTESVSKGVITAEQKQTPIACTEENETKSHESD